MLAFQVCWTAPTLNVDGSPVLELSSFAIFLGPSSGNYTRRVDVPGHLTCANIRVGDGTYYVAATATDITGAESGLSNEVVKIESKPGGPSGGTRLEGPSGGTVITD